MELRRTFLGIAPDVQLRQSIAQCAAALSLGQIRARLLEPADYHFTLVFLGATLAQRIEVIRAALGAVAAGLHPFRYRLDRIAAFPDAERARVISLLPENAAGFALWQQPLAAALDALGFPAEKRVFRPHLSLARVRPGAFEACALPEALEGCASSVVLFESAGGHYSPIFELACAGGTGA